MTSIKEAMIRQSQDMGSGNFICTNCVKYGGNLICHAGVFIAFSLANMSNCIYYERGQVCPHCKNDY